MKNFCELLATDLKLEVVVNQQCRQAGLHQPLRFDQSDTVSVDGIEVLPRYQHLCQNGVLEIDQPFYCWYHEVSGQGWLLKPQ